LKALFNNTLLTANASLFSIKSILSILNPVFSSNFLIANIGASGYLQLSVPTKANPSISARGSSFLLLTNSSLAILMRRPHQKAEMKCKTV